LTFYARIAYFKGVHEIAALSWFFCVKTKEQNQNQFSIFISIGNIASTSK
jgi:hypothetical protein